MAITYRADWVFTGSGEPIRNGILQVSGGNVIQVEAWKQHPVDVDLGHSLIIPGLVNAHTHLDLGALHQKLLPPKQFTDWLLQVIDYRRQGNAAEWKETIEQGIQASLRHGTTQLHDISFEGLSHDLLGRSVLQGSAYLELIGLSEERIQAALRQAEQFALNAPSGFTPYSPHAPYTVAAGLLRKLIQGHPDSPVAMHVAETREELELLEHQSGPFVSFLEKLGVWQPSQLYRSLDDLLDDLFTFPRVYLVHGNYLEEKYWKRFRPPDRVVYCPRSHAYFGHEPHPYREMLEEKVPLALGTDSLASNPDLSILNEARYLWQRDHFDGWKLLKMATNDGISAITSSMPADFVVVPIDANSNDPWETLWAGTSEPSATYIAGRKVTG